MDLRVDVIMPTWNSARMLGPALECIERGVRPARVIIVDRDSSDGTREIARAHGCTIISDTVSLGSARMKGIEASGTEWVLFVDDDVLVPPDFMARMEEHVDDRTGAIWSPCISTLEPLRSRNLSDLERELGRDGSYTLKEGERGFTNATLVRRRLIQDLDLSDMNAWEDWAMAQAVMASGMDWKVVRVFSEHVHEDLNFFHKASWNLAGLLSLGRSGRKSLRWTLTAYAQHLRFYALSAINETAKERDPFWFFFYGTLLLGGLCAPRHLVGTRERRPRPPVRPPT